MLVLVLVLALVLVLPMKPSTARLLCLQCSASRWHTRTPTH